jgi:hypothetical protein
MELFQLKYFVNIADTLSFSRAAELQHVSQPAQYIITSYNTDRNNILDL